jgi:hypothetical protein
MMEWKSWYGKSWYGKSWYGERVAPQRATPRSVAGVLGGQKAACAAGGWWPWKVLPIGSDASLLPLKIGLDNGGHFPAPQ